MGIQIAIVTVLFIASLFFTDDRICIVNLTLWILAIFVIGKCKDSGRIEGIGLVYLLLLIITFFIEIMFLRIAAIEEKKHGKIFWIVFAIVFSLCMFAMFSSPIKRFNLIESLIGALLLTSMVCFLLYELCFIYIFVPISLLCVKKEKLINADIKAVSRRTPKGGHYTALQIPNYSSRDFDCNKETRVKFEKRRKDVKTIEAIRVPLFNIIIIPEI